MHVTYSPEVEAFRSEVRAWLDENLEPRARRRARSLEPGDVRGRLDLRVVARGVRRARAVGLRVGGAGRGVRQRRRAPMRVSSLGEILVGPTLLHWGTDEQKQEFLPRILPGDIVWCQGFSEPEAGSDLASLTTRAVRDGDDFVVDGEKIWTSEAEASDYMILLARTNPDVPRHGGISFLLLPMDQPGVDVQPIAQPDGTAGFNRVVLQGARCPAVNVVGGIDNGWKVAMTTLGFERGTSTVTSYHRFRRDVDEIIATARARGIAGDPIVRQRIACARGSRSRSSGSVASARSPGSSTAETTADLAALESVNKLYWTEHDKRAMNLAVDLLGPDACCCSASPTTSAALSVGLGHRAVVHEYPASPLQTGFLFSLSGTIYGGTSEVQRNVIAERTLGLPREPSG